MTQRITISISNQDKEYLTQDKLLSPSKIFQSALHNIKQNRENLRERIKQLELLLNRYTNFIFEANLKDKFNEWGKNAE